MSIEQEQIEVLRFAMSCILDVAKEAGPLGAPSGVIYSVMSAKGMRLNTYYSLLGAMEKAGKIKVEYDCVFPA